MNIEKSLQKLRTHLTKRPYHVPEFKRGEEVILDNGAVGIVFEDTDSEGETAVFYIEDGKVRGPSIGWRLSRIGN